MYETYSTWGSFGMILLTTLLAASAAFVCLRLLDRLSGIHFRQDVFDTIKISPMALSLYVTGRFIGVLGFMAYQFGRFI
jgi:hypothetical protein